MKWGIFGMFVAYLRGIETHHRVGYSSAGSEFVAYLRGIETT